MRISDWSSDVCSSDLHSLAAALSAFVLAGCAVDPVQSSAPAAPAEADILTIDTHVDIPLDYMRDPRFDVGTDTPLQVDLGKMERGGLDAAFFVIYVGQGPLTPEGYADAVAQAERKYSAIEMMLQKYPDRIRAATTPQQVRDTHAAGLPSAMIGIENGYSLGQDRKSVVSGKSVSGRVAHGGGRIIKKKK